MYTDKIIPKNSLVRVLNSKNHLTFRVVAYNEKSKLYLLETANSLYKSHLYTPRNNIQRIHMPKAKKVIVKPIERVSLPEALRTLLNPERQTTTNIGTDANNFGVNFNNSLHTIP